MNLFRRRRRELKQLAFRVHTLEVAVDCLLSSPRYVPSDATGFNGQAFRKRIFQELVRAFDCEAIVETGTYTGNTTGFMATTTGLTVYSCEANPTFHAIAKRRLEAIPSVSLALGDSCGFLRDLAKAGVSRKRCFVYLDAHWHEDLPLAEEIELLAKDWPDFVAMVDDFEVPGDPGYGHDDYGKVGNLSLKDFAPVIERAGLVPFFPSLPADKETGYKRGSVILARKGAAEAKLAALSVLRRA